MIKKILAKRREESYEALYQLTKKGDGTCHEKHSSDCKNSFQVVALLQVWQCGLSEFTVMWSHLYSICMGLSRYSGFWLPQSKDMLVSPIAEDGRIYIKKGGSNQTCHSGGNPEEKTEQSQLWQKPELLKLPLLGRSEDGSITLDYTAKMLKINIFKACYKGNVFALSG